MDNQNIGSFAAYYGSEVKKRGMEKSNFRWKQAHSLWLREWMLANRFFSLSQESQWSDLLDAVGLAEISDDSNEDNQDNEDEDPNVAKDKEDLRLYLVNKLKIKIATIRGQLTIEGKLRPTGISTIPYQPVADTELIKNKLNAVLAIADGHEELVKSLTNAWLEKRKEDSQGSQDQGE